MVSIDSMGPLTPLPKGNMSILVISDHFTRWRDVLRLQNRKVKMIAELLEERVFSYLGVPECSIQTEARNSSPD